MQKKGMQERELLLSLVTEVAELARPPLSKFHVGSDMPCCRLRFEKAVVWCSAAGLGKSGAVYLGMNLEFEGVPLYNTVTSREQRTSMMIVSLSKGPCRAVRRGKCFASQRDPAIVPCCQCRSMWSLPSVSLRVTPCCEDMVLSIAGRESGRRIS